MGSFVCGCCKKQLPDMHKHVHHKIPRSVGGKDIQSNLIDLCPGCHDFLHSLARRMLSKKVSHAQITDTLCAVYPSNHDAQTVCMELAVNVRNSYIATKEKGLGPNHLVTIGTTLRKYYKPLIESRSRELNLTQESYIRMLIIQDIAKRFNLTASLTEENRLINYIKKEKSNAHIDREE